MNTQIHNNEYCVNFLALAIFILTLYDDEVNCNFALHQRIDHSSEECSK